MKVKKKPHGVGALLYPSVQKAAAGKSRGAPGSSALFKELKGYSVRPSLKKKKERKTKEIKKRKLNLYRKEIFIKIFPLAKE